MASASKGISSLRSLSGRQVQADDVQAIKQILAEFSLGDAFSQILVGGADDAHVNRLFGVVPQLAYAAFLNDAQQFDLHGKRQVGNLIQQQGAAVGRLKKAVPVFIGAGERAFTVAEEFGFPSGFREWRHS